MLLAYLRFVCEVTQNKKQGERNRHENQALALALALFCCFCSLGGFPPISVKKMRFTKAMPMPMPRSYFRFLFLVVIPAVGVSFFFPGKVLKC